LRPSAAIQTLPSAEDGYIAKRTLSGHSLASFEHYASDWNAIDFDEVTSNPPSETQAAGPSLLAQKVQYALAAAEVAKRSLEAVDATAKVIESKTLIPPQSPRFKLNWHCWT
jgi:hypothetical protein